VLRLNEVARRWASTTSQRETTSRALKCFSSTPRRRRTSLVSISTKSPGCAIRQCLGLRIAQGRFRSLRRARRNSAYFGRLVQRSASFKIAQNSTHYGNRNAAPCSVQQHRQFVFSPTRILFAQRQHLFGQGARPGRSAHLMWSMRTRLQSAQVVAIESAPPAIESLSADAKVPTRPLRVAAIQEIKQHPLKSLLPRTA
jgi:hypothetical protein